MNKEDIALNYDNDLNPNFFRIRANVIKKLINQYKPKNVLEVGCGTGIFLDHFHESFERAVGIDNCKPMLEFAEKHHKRNNIRYIFSIDNHLPFKDNQFDMVLSMGVIEYVENQKKHIEECMRVIRKGGVLFLTTPTKSMTGIYGAVRKIGLAAERYWTISRYLSFDELHTLVRKNRAKIIEHNILFFNPSNIRTLDYFFKLVKSIIPGKLHKYLLGVQYLVVKKSI